MKRCAPLLAGLFLAACGSPARDWTRPGASDAQFAADKRTCRQAAARALDIRPPPTIGVEQAGGAQRQAAFDNCMTTAGYRIVATP